MERKFPLSCKSPALTHVSRCVIAAGKHFCRWFSQKFHSLEFSLLRSGPCLSATEDGEAQRHSLTNDLEILRFVSSSPLDSHTARFLSSEGLFAYVLVKT